MFIERAPLGELFEFGVAEKQSSSVHGVEFARPVEQRHHGGIGLDIDRDVDVCRHAFEQFRQRDHRFWQLGPFGFCDRSPSHSERAVVVEDQLTIGTEPHVGFDARRSELDRQIELSISRLVQETNKAVEEDIKEHEAKSKAEKKEAQRLQKLAEEQARQRKKTLDELALLDDQVFYEEQSRNLEEAARRSAMGVAPDEVVRKKKRSILSRLLPFGLLRGTFRGNGPSDYL